MKWAIVSSVALAACVMAGAIAWLTRGNDAPQVADAPYDISRSAPASSSEAESAFRFDDVTAESGITFTHFSGISPHRYQPEAMGSGVALVDVDGNGLLDVYFLSGCALPVESSNAGPGFRLFSQQSPGKFVDVSAKAGVTGGGYGQGIAVGDFDNDGFADLYVTRLGSNLLLRNNGDGSFAELPNCGGADDVAWSAGCAWFDADADGNLDLYVANYCDWSTETHPTCHDTTTGRRSYCHPRELRPIAHSLFRNNGAGGFHNISREAGITRDDGRGLGVVALDVDNDRYTDLFVANDSTPNHLYINKAGRGFVDRTDDSGAAYDNLGATQACMGVDAEDVDGDGLPDLFVTNFYREKNTLYRNLGGALFADITDLAGASAGTLNTMGWGTALADFDGDNWPDIFVSNGHLDESLTESGTPYLMPALIWRNVGQGRFQLAKGVQGTYFEAPHAGRAAAFGDIDNDGATDICLNHLGQSATVLLNRSRQTSRSSFSRIELIGRRTNRDGVGAALKFTAGDRTLVRHRKGGGSFLSASDSRILICVDPQIDVEGSLLCWPSGAVTAMDAWPAGDLLVLEPLTD